MKFFRNLHTDAMDAVEERLTGGATAGPNPFTAPKANAGIERDDYGQNNGPTKSAVTRPVHEVTNENLHRTFTKAQKRLNEVEQEIKVLQTEKAQLEVTMKATNAAIEILSDFGVENAVDRELRESFEKSNAA